MGSTPRQHLYQIPMPTRSTEASSECFGRLALSWFREDEQTPASYFILGDVLHRAIEQTIRLDWDLDQAITWMMEEFERQPKEGLESSARGFDSMPVDAKRMMANWFLRVHPDSSKRMSIYDEYQWPPVVEVPFQRYVGTNFPIWGSADTVFEAKPDGVPVDAKGYYLVVDWKSGTGKVKSDFQLDFYRFGLGIPNARAGFHHLDRVREFAVFQEAHDYPGDEVMREAVRRVEVQKIDLLDGRMPKFSPDWYCNYCPVQAVCPVDGDPRKREGNRENLAHLVKLATPMVSIDLNIEG